MKTGTSAYHADIDVRAEVVAADLAEAGHLLDTITIKPAGLSRRTYSRDVLKVQIEEELAAADSRVTIETCREGIYDMLPEGLIHQPDPNRKLLSVEDMLYNIKKNRREESDARKFFLAIEKELYRQRILVEIQERKALSEYSSYYRNELFFELWPELKPLKPEYLAPLLQILPRASEIIGNIEITAFALSKVLGDEVQISSTPLSIESGTSVNQTTIGRSRLGIDCFAGDVFIDQCPSITITIGPVGKKRLAQYLHQGEASQVLSVLIDFLIPAEARIDVQLKCSPEEEPLILNTNPVDGLLGYNSRI